MNSPLRITLVHPAFRALGGAEVLVASHAGFLREAGMAVRILTLDYDEGRWGSSLSGAEVVSRRGSIGTRERLGERVPGRELRDAWWMHRAIERDESDVIIAYNHPSEVMLGHARHRGRAVWHCNEPPRNIYYDAAQPVMSARARSESPPYLEVSSRFYHRHRRRVTLWPAIRGAYRWMEWRNRKAIQAIPTIWALSHYSALIVGSIYGRHDAKVVYPLVKFAERCPPRQGLRRDQLRILVQTRLENAKNVDTVLRAAALLQRDRRMSFHIDIVGEGAFRRELEGIAAELSLGERVSFLGWLSREELERTYERADVFALVPLDEPFGLVFPEAASRGLLMVGPDHGGPSEILEQGKIGWTVDALSPEALAAAFLEVWETSDAEVDRRREQADRSCRARFGREAVGARLLELVRSA